MFWLQQTRQNYSVFTERKSSHLLARKHKLQVACDRPKLNSYYAMTIYPPMAFLLSVRLQTGNVSDTWDMRHDELNHILRSTSFKRKGTQNI